MDSASSSHVAKMRDFFVDIKEVKAGDHRVYMGNNTYCDVLDIGTVKIMILGERNLYLSGVLFAPTMRCNLTSIPCLHEKRFETRIRFRKVSIRKHGRILCGVWILCLKVILRISLHKLHSAKNKRCLIEILGNEKFILPKMHFANSHF
jgi:hypothetical protein